VELTNLANVFQIDEDLCRREAFSTRRLGVELAYLLRKVRQDERLQKTRRGSN